MIPLVFEHQGTLDKLMGDAIMAFFGAPRELDDHPRKAAETALAMIRRLEELKAEGGERGIDRLQVGIGLNTGQVTVGNLGSQSFMDYTVIGDTVNLGARLESLNKVYGTSIIVSEFTANRIGTSFLLRELDLVRVKGKTETVTIFELIGLKDDADEVRMKLLDVFASGMGQYRNREWDQAEETFHQLLGLFPGDGPSQLYLERIKALKREPPSSEWECVTVFSTK
jgi:adenylate cyclase